MKRTLFSVILLLSVATLLAIGMVYADKHEGAKAEKAEKAEKEITVTGEVVDLKCLIGMNMKGEGHKGCAISCAKAGHALAILSGEGENEKIYLPIGQIGDKSVNEALKEHAGSQVTIEGKAVKKGGSLFLMAKSLKKA